MSITLEIETEITEEIRIEPSLMENRTRLLLSKRDNFTGGLKDLGRMMAEFDPNGS